MSKTYPLYNIHGYEHYQHVKQEAAKRGLRIVEFRDRNFCCITDKDPDMIREKYGECEIVELN